MPISSDDLETAVTLESSRTGVVEEPPFRILVLGDWSGAGEKKDLDDRKAIEIDRDEFDDVFANLGVAIELDFPDGTIIPLEFSELKTKFYVVATDFQSSASSVPGGTPIRLAAPSESALACRDFVSSRPASRFFAMRHYRGVHRAAS